MAALPYPRPSSSAATAVMRANRSRDTRPEVRLRSALHRRGLRFRKSYLVQTGSARVHVDVAFPSLKIAVFVDGCFWHRCPSHGVRPSVNQAYWPVKLQRNVERDVRVNDGLISAGWTVVRVWEHEEPACAADRVAAIVGAQRSTKGTCPAICRPP